MPSVRVDPLDVVLSFFALVYAGVIAREAVYRMKAGPVRFRLALASLAKPARSNPSMAYVMIALAFILLLLGVITSNLSAVSRLMPFWLMWVGVHTISVNSRRDAKRWPVAAAGLLGLVAGVASLAVGYLASQAGKNPAPDLPWPLILVYAIIFLVTGAGALQEYFTGTRVRERGIEMFWATRPWSRIAVKDWRAREGGFDLHLIVSSLRVFGTQWGPDREFIVPVSASDRPALEVFLAGHKPAVDGSGSRL